MILQRLATSIRKQDWFTVLIETLIVVLGVFLGIQLGNWNDARGDHAREAVYLERLVGDLERDGDVLREVTQSQQARLAAIAAILGDAFGEAQPESLKTSASVGDHETEFPFPPGLELNEAERDSFLSYALLGRIFNETNTTFASLQSTGDIVILRNQDLAYELARYYATVDNVKELEEGTVRRARDEAATVAKRNGLNPFGRNDYDAVVAAVAADPELAASLRALRSMAVLDYSAVTTVSGWAAELGPRVAAEAGE
ncbi:hypothetical protein [Henriciella sp.]|uniref:hypothetical protein n=1 Tax=Henriciella sp. TaxID=1968823 RepID=UPI0017913740|nr:hypothetical protein [Henriciella sp.]HIG23368.1 hypothetical protein [Henriciella sp.]